MLRFEMILFGKDTGSFSRYYEPSGKDILPLAEEVKHYLKHWGVNKYEPIEKEKLLRTHNGYISVLWSGSKGLYHNSLCIF